jgi:hypothetical protein
MFLFFGFSFGARLSGLMRGWKMLENVFILWVSS